MNITDIVHKIENPSLCSKEDVKDFEELILKYPYAQTFPILLLKTLGQTKDIHFEDALNQHAFRVSDRMHLYYLIHDISADLAAVDEEVSSSKLQVASSEEEELEEVDEVVSSSKLPVESYEEELKEVDEVVSSSKLPVESYEEELKEDGLVFPSSNELDENKKNAIELNSSSKSDEKIIRLDYEKLLDQDIKFKKVEEMTFEPVRIHLDELDVPILKKEEAEVSKSKLKIESFDDVDQEVDDVVSSSKVEVSSFEQDEGEVSSLKKEGDEDSDFSGMEFEFFDPTKELEISQAVEDLTILKPSSFEEQRKVISLDFIEKKFNIEADEFTSNAISQGFHVTLEDENVPKSTKFQKEESPEVQPNISETIQKFERNSTDEKKSFYAWLHADKKPEHSEKQDRSTEIIEKFIQEEPKISRSVKETDSIEIKKTPFFKATEIAKESLKESVIPVSATLAQIFEAQGNFPKAIHSYEQLMLLYPEKKTFFANQIKKLKKKLNN